MRYLNQTKLNQIKQMISVSPVDHWPGCSTLTLQEHFFQRAMEDLVCIVSRGLIYMVANTKDKPDELMVFLNWTMCLWGQ